MPSAILITFDLTKPGAVGAHAIRNFAEILDRDILQDRHNATSIDEDDPARTEILVQLRDAKASGRTAAMIRKMLKQYALADFAAIFVDGRKVSTR